MVSPFLSQTFAGIPLVKLVTATRETPKRNKEECGGVDQVFF